MRVANLRALNEGDEIDAVELLVTRKSGDRGGRRGDVEVDDRRLERLSRRQRAGPSGQERCADAAVGEHPFFADQRKVERPVPRAGLERRSVVANEEDQRILLDSFRREFRPELAYSIV